PHSNIISPKATETLHPLQSIEDLRYAVKLFLKSPVREIRTPGSVGVRATSWVAPSTRRRGLAAPSYTIWAYFYA
ncbi:hypothetical protein, partial [uncultured Paenibacillus sp.]|uniref:hypothetical protein n=1 Tax=uncultured Paenibacillus sp. TaxID=227322 RepID=UPI002804C182